MVTSIFFSISSRVEYGEVGCETLEWIKRKWNTRWACALQAYWSRGRRLGEPDRTCGYWTILFKLRMLKWCSCLCHVETSVYELLCYILKCYSTNTTGKVSREKRNVVKHANHGYLLHFSFLLYDAKHQLVTRRNWKIWCFVKNQAELRAMF